MRLDPLGSFHVIVCLARVHCALQVRMYLCTILCYVYSLYDYRVPQGPKIFVLITNLALLQRKPLSVGKGNFSQQVIGFIVHSLLVIVFSVGVTRVS